MGNINKFYNLAKKVQDRRHNARMEYFDRMEELKPMAGSEYFKEESRRAREEMDTVVNGCKSYRAEFQSIIDDMKFLADNRSLTAPTEEQERICRMLAMKSTLTKEDLSRAAKACSDAPLALDVLDDMARDKGVHNFRSSDYSDGKNLSDTVIDNIFHEIEAGLDSFLATDRKRASILAARFQMMNYGMEYDEIDLAERDLFNDEAGCFAEIGGLTDAKTFKAFSNVVDY